MFTFSQWRKFVTKMQRARVGRRGRRAPTFRPSLLDLEQRLTPSGNVTATFHTHTLTLAGSGGDSVTITEAGNQIVVTPTGGTTLNGGGGAESYSGVNNININFSGHDSVNFQTGPESINLTGYLSATFGTGSSTFTTGPTKGASGNTSSAVHTNTLHVGGNMSVAYGNGAESTNLDNFIVGGTLAITHQNGDATVKLGSDSLGTVFNSVGGSLIVNNANASGCTLYNGVDSNSLLDTDVGGNLLVNMGNPGTDSVGNPDIAGFTTFGTDASGTQLHVGGNVTISANGGFLDAGTFSKGGLEVLDTNVGGNVTLQARDTGAIGDAAIFFGENTSGMASTVHGSLSATTCGPHSDIEVFDTNVQRDLCVSVNGFSSDIVLSDVNVVGATNLYDSGSADEVVIDGTDSTTGSQFHGAFELTTGNGADTVLINSDGFTGTTYFDRPVNIYLGGGSDSMEVGASGHVSFSGGTINGGSGTNHLSEANIEGPPPHFINFV